MEPEACKICQVRCGCKKFFCSRQRSVFRGHKIVNPDDYKNIESLESFTYDFSQVRQVINFLNGKCCEAWSQEGRGVILRCGSKKTFCSGERSVVRGQRSVNPDNYKKIPSIGSFTSDFLQVRLLEPFFGKGPTGGAFQVFFKFQRTIPIRKC